MLVEFRVKNHKSLKDEYAWSMAASPERESYTDTIPYQDIHIVRSSYILGSREIQKQDLINALGYMQFLIIGDYPSKGYYIPRGPGYPTIGKTDTSADSEYSVVFTKSRNCLIEYRIVITEVNTIKSESLCLVTPKDEILIFDRNDNNIVFNKRMSPSVITACQNIPKDQLITNLCHIKKIDLEGHSCIFSVLDFFLCRLTVYGDYDFLTVARIRNILKYPEYVRTIQDGIKNIDPELVEWFDKYRKYWCEHEWIESYDALYDIHLEWLVKLYILRGRLRMTRMDQTIVLGNLGAGINDIYIKDFVELFTTRMSQDINLQLLASSQCAGCLMNLNFIENDQLYLVYPNGLRGVCEYKSIDKNNRYSAFLSGRI